MNKVVKPDGVHVQVRTSSSSHSFTCSHAKCLGLSSNCRCDPPYPSVYSNRTSSEILPSSSVHSLFYNPRHDHLAINVALPTHPPSASPLSASIHQMDTFTLAENPSGPQSFLDYDERGQIKKNGSAESYDVEAQEISDEFKRPPYHDWVFTVIEAG